jgi:hypothetical protein
MQTFTPPAPYPTGTLAGASAALKRLGELSTRLRAELERLPAAESALLDAIIDQDAASLHGHQASLLQRVDRFWATTTEPDENRYTAFLAAMSQALRDELSLKCHERNIEARYIGCLPPHSPPEGQDAGPAPENYCLQVQLQDELWVELAGALAMAHPQGHVLLVLPGVGAMGFASRTDMAKTLMQWLNEPVSKHALINCMSLRSQDWLTAVESDPDVYIEAFSSADLRLQPVTGDPFVQALESLLSKQRDDIAHACSIPSGTDRQRLQAVVEDAIGLHGLPGPSAMLELREMASLESRYRQSLPDWIKTASNRDLEIYNQRLLQHDQARETMLSALGAAASPQKFAAAQLRARIANDLGCAIDPFKLNISTRRTLPLTDETYTVTRSLVELALCGLHPGDRTAGSAFLAATSLTLDDASLGAAYEGLTPDYLAALIEELDPRLQFAEFQRKAYDNVQNQQLMNTLTHRQIRVLATAAQMQGHIRAQDFATVEACMDAGTSEQGVAILKVRLGGHLMGKLLLFCKLTSSGQPERLILFAADKSQGNGFMAFDNQAQLVHELVAWTASDESSDYLLTQVEAGPREQLAQTLADLRLKPHPQPDFVQLAAVTDVNAGLQHISDEHIRLALLEQQLHTPDWYRSASPDDRQQLLALEDAVAGALGNYQTKAHSRVQPFNAYVHQRASEQISQLLNRPVGDVDPDQIIITSERETLSYTQMLLNGYDDSINFTQSGAATQATFSGPPGIDLSLLTPERVAGSVNGKWLGDDYMALIRATLLDPDGEGYAYRRTASLMMTQLQMKAAALRSCLKGHIDSLQYTWLKASIEQAHLSDSTHREQYPLYPLQIHVDKPFIGSGLTGVDQVVIPATSLTHVETVQGCLIVLPTGIRYSALLYTPQAPDGLEFRTFGDFTSSLKTPGMIDYYKDRCRVQAGRTLSFFLHDMAQGKASKPPVIPRDAISDFADICYNRPIERMIRDVSETTTGRSEMIARLVWTTVELTATLVALPFVPASFAVGVTFAMHDTVRAFQALRDGDSVAAAAHVLTSMLNSLGAAGDLHSGLKGFGGLIHRLDRNPRPGAALRPLPDRSSLPRYEDLFPARIENETALLGPPSLDGHARVFTRGQPGSGRARPTEIHVAREKNGTWRPVDSQPAPATASGEIADVSVSLTLHNAHPMTAGHANGVRMLDGKCYIQMSGKTWQVQYDAQLRCWQIIDPANPFAFSGKQPVRLAPNGEWQLLRRPRLMGGGLDDAGTYRPLPEEGAGSVSARVGEYEMPEPMRPGLDVIISKAPYDPIGVGLEAYFESFLIEWRQTFSALREKLYGDAHAFYLGAVPPTRPTLPAPPANATIETLLPALFAHNPGLVLSESAKSVASKRLLIRNMPLLKEQRVEIIYLEHLFTDKHVEKLARYYRMGRKTRSGSHEIKDHLKEVNGGALNNLSREYDYYHLIKAAHRHGIEIRPLNSSISYPLLNHPVVSATEDAAAAQKMSGFFAHTLLASDVAREPSRRWIALLDEQLATTHNQLPGLAELQGAPSIHVRDVAPGQPSRIRAGTTGDSGAHPDFTIEYHNPLLVAAPLPEATFVDTALQADLASRQTLDVGERWAGEYGFRWQEGTDWQHIPLGQWSPDSPPNAIQQSLTDPAYEIAMQERSVLYQLANFERKGLDEDYFLADAELNRVRDEFFTRRRKLRTDARHISSIEQRLRASLPVPPPQVALPEFLETLYQQADGVVVGESHSSIASKQLIIDNLPRLARQNVRTLYMEHLLTDLHQADLDRFLEKGEMSKTLLYTLKKLDQGHHTDPSGVYTFEQLVLKARQHGLEVRAIDCSASYYLKGLARAGSTSRQQMMNYFASRTIRKHQEVMGSHKWIALVGNSHSNTYQGRIPGIAELEGAMGLNVIDVAPGQPTSVMLDPGARVRVGLGNDSVLIKGDYRVEIPSTAHANDVLQQASTPVEARLTRPGMFMLEQEGNGARTIVHRSRDGSVQRTPVLTDAQGKLYLTRPGWTGVHLTPYDNIEALIAALEAKHLTRVG